MGRKLIHISEGEMGEDEAARFAALEEQAAAIYGITYQTYLKQAAVRQALADLKAAYDAFPEPLSC